MTVPEDLAVMLAKARRYMQSAELLRQQRDYDSAVSRLYYAMFYCAAALLKTRGLTFSSHKGVIASFGRYFVKTGPFPQELHQWLREAFDAREIGDYQFATPIIDADVLKLKTRAEQFIAATEAYLQQQIGRSNTTPEQEPER